MKKIERIIAIIVLLLENERISAAQLAERFDVTKRTIFRDIETIELAGFPIIAHSGRNGGFSFMSSFKLHTYTYSGAEKQDLLHALAIKEGLFGVVDQQNTIKEKITLLQPKTTEQPTYFSFDSPSMHRKEIEAETKNKINQINLALKHRYKIVIRYVDNRGEFTKRKIHPYELMLRNGSWYLYSYCEIRAAFRYFKITRIRQLIVQQQSFQPITKHSTEQRMEKETQFIQLRFDKKELGKLYDFYLDSELTIQENYVDAQFVYHHEQSLLPFLLMFGHSVKVLKPDTLKEVHKQEIKKMKEND